MVRRILPVATVFVAAACSPALHAELRRDPDAALPPFDTRAVEGHLAGLGGGRDRSTGTAGFVEAAEHAAAAFRRIRLQPLAGGDHRITAYGPRNHPTDAHLMRLGADTVVVGLSAELAPDGRSDAGTVRASRVWMPRPAGAREAGPAPAPVAVLGAADTSTATLLALRDRGVRVAIETVARVPVTARRPIERLLLVRAGPSTARLVAPLTPGESLAVDLVVRVVGRFDPAAQVVSVYGLVAGSDPHLRRELVVLGAPLDHAGSDGEAVGAAAVVEAARVLSELGRRGEGPDRSVLFALWGGTREGETGLRSWLANPAWAQAHLRAVVGVNLSVPPDLSGRIRPLWYDVPAPGPVEAAASLARHLLLDVAGDLWERDGPKRVPQGEARSAGRDEAR